MMCFKSCRVNRTHCVSCCNVQWHIVRQFFIFQSSSQELAIFLSTKLGWNVSCIVLTIVVQSSIYSITRRFFFFVLFINYFSQSQYEKYMISIRAWSTDEGWSVTFHQTTSIIFSVSGQWQSERPPIYIAAEPSLVIIRPIPFLHLTSCPYNHSCHALGLISRTSSMLGVILVISKWMRPVKHAIF